MKSDVKTAERQAGFMVSECDERRRHLGPCLNPASLTSEGGGRPAGRHWELLTSCLSGLLQEVEQHAGGLVHAQLLRVLTAGL